MCEIELRLRCLLRDQRNSQGISQRQLEVLSNVPRSRISLYENNKVIMSVETAAKFAVILNCSLDDLFDYRSIR